MLVERYNYITERILCGGEVSETTYKKLSMTRLTPKLYSLMTLSCIPQIFEMQYLHIRKHI